MHVTTVTVRFSELDPYGHVNHAVYLSYLEDARVEALEGLGYGIERLRAEGVLLPVVDLRVRYRRSATLGQRLEVGTAVTELGAASTGWRQWITHAGETVVEADMRGAVTDASGRPRRLPEGFASALAAFASPR